MVAKELDHSRQIGFPIVRPAFQVYENRRDAGFEEERYGIFKVFIEIGAKIPWYMKCGPEPTSKMTQRR